MNRRTLFKTILIAPFIPATVKAAKEPNLYFDELVPAIIKETCDTPVEFLIMCRRGPISANGIPCLTLDYIRIPARLETSGYVNDSLVADYYATHSITEAFYFKRGDQIAVMHGDKSMIYTSIDRDITPINGDCVRFTVNCGWGIADAIRDLK